MGRALVAAGIVLIVAGVMVMAGVPLGRLPGDIVIRRGSGAFYFPIVTCVVVSVVLTIILSIVRR